MNGVLKQKHLHRAALAAQFAVGKNRQPLPRQLGNPCRVDGTTHAPVLKRKAASGFTGRLVDCLAR